MRHPKIINVMLYEQWTKKLTFCRDVKDEYRRDEVRRQSNQHICYVSQNLNERSVHCRRAISLLRWSVLKVFLCVSAKIRRRRICHLGLRAVRDPASHKPTNQRWQRAKALGADNRVILVLVLIYDCLFNRSSFKGLLSMRHPKPSLINHNELIIWIEIYAFWGKVMKLDADCDRTMQYYVGMMQHGDGMVPRQSNVGVGFIHILLHWGNFISPSREDRKDSAKGDFARITRTSQFSCCRRIMSSTGRSGSRSCWDIHANQT